MTLSNHELNYAFTRDAWQLFLALMVSATLTVPGDTAYLISRPTRASQSSL